MVKWIHNNLSCKIQDNELDGEIMFAGFLSREAFKHIKNSAGMKETANDAYRSHQEEIIIPDNPFDGQ